MMRSTPFTTSYGLGQLHAIVADLAGFRVADRMFTAQDLPLRLIEEKGEKVPLQELLGLHENAARFSGDELFGLKIGQRFRLEDFGLFGRYAVEAPDLSTMLRRAVRALPYHQSGGTTRAVRRGDLVRWSYRLDGDWCMGRRHHANHAVLPMLQAVRGFAGRAWHPLWLELEASARPLAQSIEDFVQVPVRFDQPANALVFPATDLSRPNRRAMPLAKRLTIFDLRRLLAKAPPQTLVEQTRAVVRLRLLDGKVDIEGTAEKLQVGVRTLQRALSSDSTSYRRVLDAVRYERAIELLSDSDLSVQAIASALGYSEEPHFRRAFRRWAGRPPGAFLASSRPAQA